MINPVTSTKVDTKGADELAGSAPRRLSKKGNIDPVNDPHKTTPIRDRHTTKPTSIQCSPYVCVKNCQVAIRKKPNVPNITPRIAPEITSLFITRHQSPMVTSPKAIAWII